ncbi:MAG: hypothetical protein ACOYJS_07155 [Acutalibacteraceae bacterium]|jgi:hypothetical protein
MLFRKLISQFRIILITFLLIAAAGITALRAWKTTKGELQIENSPNQAGFTLNLEDWNAQKNCELSLKAQDVIEIEVALTSGKISLDVIGKNGSSPYTGNKLKSVKFTVTMPETDKYIFKIVGKKATGKITVKKLNPIPE